MYKLCVFAGTTEGRELVELLADQPAAVTACVATEYGGSGSPGQWTPPLPTPPR